MGKCQILFLFQSEHKKRTVIQRAFPRITIFGYQKTRLYNIVLINVINKFNQIDSLKQGRMTQNFAQNLNYPDF